MVEAELGGQSPTRIELKTAALPRNPAGKILKRALRDEASASS